MHEGSSKGGPPAIRTGSEADSIGFLRVLDGLLRRREEFFERIFQGQEMGRLLRCFLTGVISLSAFYGMTMGLLSFHQGAGQGLLQMAASGLKVPALYLLSLAVCFPVLYIVLVLMGARLTFGQTLGLILMALTLNAVLLASCAPIVVFFTITGSNYHFIKLLQVAIFAFSGAWAMMALWQGLRLMCEKSDLYPRQAIRILQVWILVFGFVGTQMAWSMRPYVGSPDLPFQWFRSSQPGNFYWAVWESVTSVFPNRVPPNPPSE